MKMSYGPYKQTKGETKTLLGCNENRNWNRLLRTKHGRDTARARSTISGGGQFEAIID